MTKPPVLQGVVPVMAKKASYDPNVQWAHPVSAPPNLIGTVMKMRKQRSCKHGSRMSDGKCPKKTSAPTARKTRACKHSGPRTRDGKCPKKPSSGSTARKTRACKYPGSRTSDGKCPKKPSSSTPMKQRDCLHGPRKSDGKCPPRPYKAKVTVKSTLPFSPGGLIYDPDED